MNQPLIIGNPLQVPHGIQGIYHLRESHHLKIIGNQVFDLGNLIAVQFSYFFKHGESTNRPLKKGLYKRSSSLPRATPKHPESSTQLLLFLRGSTVPPANLDLLEYCHREWVLLLCLAQVNVFKHILGRFKANGNAALTALRGFAAMTTWANLSHIPSSEWAMAMTIHVSLLSGTSASIRVPWMPKALSAVWRWGCFQVLTQHLSERSSSSSHLITHDSY